MGGIITICVSVNESGETQIPIQARAGSTHSRIQLTLFDAGGHIQYESVVNGQIRDFQASEMIKPVS
jgi:hypothetical protein